MSKTTVPSSQIRNDSILVEDLADFAVILGSNLNITVQAGRLRNNNVITDKTAQSVALTNNTTNYVELNTSGVASANTSGFTSGYVPLAIVVTVGGSITTITDKRTWTLITGVFANVTRGTFVNGDLSSGKLILTHSKGYAAPYSVTIVIFDNNNKQIIPDNVEGKTNTIEIDLTSFGTLTGTWGYAYTV